MSINAACNKLGVFPPLQQLELRQTQLLACEILQPQEADENNLFLVFFHAFFSPRPIFSAFEVCGRRRKAHIRTVDHSISSIRVAMNDRILEMLICCRPTLLYGQNPRFPPVLKKSLCE